LITAFAEAQPTASLQQLADDLRADGRTLGLSAGAWALQLAELRRKDAEQVGAAGIERMAQRLLVSELASAIPTGWLARWTDTHDARAAASKLSTAPAPASQAAAREPGRRSRPQAAARAPGRRSRARPPLVPQAAARAPGRSSRAHLM
jgi:hypothetical protein